MSAPNHALLILVEIARPAIEAARKDYLDMEKRARRAGGPQAMRDADAFKNSVAGMDVVRGILNEALQTANERISKGPSQ